MGRWLELEEWRGGYGGEPGREGERRARGTGGVGGREKSRGRESSESTAEQRKWR